MPRREGGGFGRRGARPISSRRSSRSASGCTRSRSRTGSAASASRTWRRSPASRRSSVGPPGGSPSGRTLTDAPDPGRAAVRRSRDPHRRACPV